jgi:antitoxin FitA
MKVMVEKALTVSLPDDCYARLQSLAQQAGVSPEALLHARIQEWLTPSPKEFPEAARHVLEKNRELYRRLA